MLRNYKTDTRQLWSDEEFTIITYQEAEPKNYYIAMYLAKDGDGKKTEIPAYAVYPVSEGRMFKIAPRPRKLLKKSKTLTKPKTLTKRKTLRKKP